LHGRSVHHLGRLLGSLRLNLEEVSSIVNFLSEFSVVLEEELDFLVGQVDEHTSDFRREGVALQLGDEVKDGVSDLLLHVRVSRDDGRDKLESVVVERLFGALRLLSGHTGSTLRHDVATFGSGHSTTHGHVHATVTVSIHGVTSGGSLVVVSHVVLTVIGASIGSLTIVVEVAALSGSHVVVVTHGHLTLSECSLLVLGKVLKELDKFVLELILGGDVVPLSLLIVDFLESLESEFILGFFVGDVTEFLEFVMADLELELVDGLSVQFGKGSLGLIGGLEADESVGFVGLVDGEHLDTLNLTLAISSEELHEFIVGSLFVEVLDVQVASLLGVLVLDGFAEEFLLALGGTESGLDVEGLAISHVLSVESLNSLGGALGAVLVVVLVLGYEAHEGESTGVGLGNLDEGANISVRLEHVNQLFVGPVFGVVLDVEVVEHSSDVSSVSGVPSDGEAFLAGLRLFEHLGGLGGVLFVLVADETIAT
jgi:hypothetical protein